MVDFQGFKENNLSRWVVLSEVIVFAGLDKAELPLDGYVMYGHLIPGFALQSKKWLLFDIDLFKNIEFDTTAFDTLILEAQRKDMLRALVQNQSHNRQGLILLLHGSPGVGKTCIAGKSIIPLVVVGA